MTVGELRKLLKLETRDNLEMRVAWGVGLDQPTTEVVNVDVDFVISKTDAYVHDCEVLARPCLLIWSPKPA